jgi:hypothetical protein
MAEFMSVSAAAANSADFTLAEGGQATLLLKDGTSNAVLQKGASANIQVKTSGGTYMQLGQLTSENPMLTVNGAGVYRVTKPAGFTLGVDKS